MWPAHTFLLSHPMTIEVNSLGLHLKNPDLYSVFQTVIRSRLSEDYVNFIVFFGGFLDAPPPAH